MRDVKVSQATKGGMSLIGASPVTLVNQLNQDPTGCAGAFESMPNGYMLDYTMTFNDTDGNGIDVINPTSGDMVSMVGLRDPAAAGVNLSIPWTPLSQFWDQSKNAFMIRANPQSNALVRKPGSLS